MSIIICTRNRADSLQETLNSLGTCAVPLDWSVELVVIDNGSTDHTRAVVQEAAFGRLATRYLWEPRRGQARARNLAIRSTSSNVLLWTDDDVRLPGAWIEHMCSPVLDGWADAVMGGVHLAAEKNAEWLSLMQKNWLAVSERCGVQSLELIGANMAFARHVLATVGEFDVNLGPGALGFRDDTDFGARLLKAGFRFWDGRACSVEHWPSDCRFTRAAFLSSAVNHGRSLAYCADWVGFRHRILAPVRCLASSLRSIWLSCAGARGAAPVTDAELRARMYAAMWWHISTGVWKTGIPKREDS